MVFTIPVNVQMCHYQFICKQSSTNRYVSRFEYLNILDIVSVNVKVLISDRNKERLLNTNKHSPDLLLSNAKSQNAEIFNNDVPFFILTLFQNLLSYPAREHCVPDVSKNVSNFFTNFFHLAPSFLFSLASFYFSYIVYFLASIETSGQRILNNGPKNWTQYGAMKFLFF